ncbi:MAG: DDE-type integrase/transposase/recombinase [Roseobacter sp.]
MRNEIYIKVMGKRTDLYRAINSCGQTLNFMPFVRRDEATTTVFFATTASKDRPGKVVTAKSGWSIQHKLRAGRSMFSR